MGMGGMGGGDASDASSIVPVTPDDARFDSRGNQTIVGLRASRELQAEQEDADREPESVVMISPLATRFASLDIDIPVDGQEYVFTSPRGEIELTARCYAESDVTRLRSLGLSLLILAVVVGIERVARRRWRF